MAVLPHVQIARCLKTAWPSYRRCQAELLQPTGAITPNLEDALSRSEDFCITRPNHQAAIFHHADPVVFEADRLLPAMRLKVLYKGAQILAPRYMVRRSLMDANLESPS